MVRRPRRHHLYKNIAHTPTVESSTHSEWPRPYCGTDRQSEKQNKKKIKKINKNKGHRALKQPRLDRIVERSHDPVFDTN